MPSPWDDSDGNQRSSALGTLLWISFVAVVGLIVWSLLKYFPDQTLTGEEEYVDLLLLLGILLFVSSGLIFVRKIYLGEFIRNLALWTALVALLMVGYTYRTELSEVYERVLAELIPGRAISSDANEIILTADASGHFYVNAEANGVRLRFLIDTGASDIILPASAARRLGIDLRRLSFDQPYQTANGVIFAARYTLDSLQVGPFRLSKVPVSVQREDMSTSLLGMSFLRRLKSFESRGNQLILRQ